MHLVYLVGAPAVGKTSLMQALTGWCWREPRDGGIPYDELWTPSQLVRHGGEPSILALEMGKRRGTYSGTDALGMSVHPRALAWLASRPHPLVLGEGDRLGCLKFLRSVAALGIDVTLVHLTVPEQTLMTRWAAERSHQNPAWRAGRLSKAANVADGWRADGRRAVHLDATTGTPHELADRLRVEVKALAALPPMSGAMPIPPMLDHSRPLAHNGIIHR